jgi:hypothetical protein
MSIPLTEIVILTSVIVILLFDIFLYLDKIQDNTISQIVIRRSKENALIPLLIGALIGHWYL